MWTKGGTNGENMVILGVFQCRQEEEGEYKCTIKNNIGKEMFEFRIFVTVEGGMCVLVGNWISLIYFTTGMDFRAMLLKRKKPAKKTQVPGPEWIETPIDVQVKEGKAEKVVFAAKLSEKDRKGKWFIRNLVTYLHQITSSTYTARYSHTSFFCLNQISGSAFDGTNPISCKQSANRSCQRRPLLLRP